jgi:hypothetical protein
MPGGGVIRNPIRVFESLSQEQLIMSLMLINPRARRKSRKPRSAAQKAATRRMLAARHGKRASNPAPRRSKRRASAKRRHNPIGLSRVHHSRPVRHHRRRRNPIGGGLGNIGGMVVNGLKGAVGSVAINAVTSFLPAAITTGKVLYATRAGLAIALGTLGRKVLGQHARVMAEGALAVNFADMINNFAQSLGVNAQGTSMLPGSQLHGASGEYMGAFLSGAHMPQALPYGSPSYSNMPSETNGELNAYVSSDGYRY